MLLSLILELLDTMNQFLDVFLVLSWLEVKLPHFSRLYRSQILSGLILYVALDADVFESGDPPPQYLSIRRLEEVSWLYRGR